VLLDPESYPKLEEAQKIGGGQTITNFMTKIKFFINKIADKDRNPTQNNFIKEKSGKILKNILNFL
jgi:hypothetical protein